MKKVKGIDISSWQGDIDAKRVKESGIGFVILRDGYRRMRDSRFFENVKRCKAAGLPIKGVYHFSYALDEEDAKEEARLSVEIAKKAGLGKDTIIFYDFEYDTVTKASEKGISLCPKDCNTFTKIFCEEVKSLGYKPGVYFNLDFYKNWYEKETLEPHVKWLADYSGEADVKCDFHQYCNTGIVDGIDGHVDMNFFYEEEEIKMGASRKKVVELVTSWEGKNEADGSYKEIIDIYNSYKGTFPRSTKMQYEWAWCAATWSALAIKLGYTHVMPIEISCGHLVEAARKMGCWIEDDAYVPDPGDAVLYDWEDPGYGDDTGWPDHIGTVIYVNETAGYMVVLEGNYKNSVKRRTLSINGKFIRGFIVPDYDENDLPEPSKLPAKTVSEVAHEVISGLWGNGEERKKNLKSRGYNYDEVQKEVNRILNGSAVKPDETSVSTNQQPTTKKVTATAYATRFSFDREGTYRVNARNGLYLRNDAGTNKKALILLPYGCEVKCYGYYTTVSGSVWLYVQTALNGVLYTGFSHSGYLTKK